MHHISSCRYNLLPVCDIIVSDNISWSKMKITHFKLIVFRTFTHQQKNSFETLFKNTSGLYQKRVDISIQFPFNCIAEALPVDSAESNLCFALSICDCSAHSPHVNHFIGHRTISFVLVPFEFFDPLELRFA